MADFTSERFPGAQLLGTWLFGVSLGCFFIALCLVVVFLAILTHGSAMISFFTLLPILGGIVAMAGAGFFYWFASLALRLMVAIEHNTHQAPVADVVEARVIR